MKPAARLQASIDLWHMLWHEDAAAALPMDKISGDYFRTRRYIGSKDRQEIAARLYDMMRCYARLKWHMARAGGDTDNARLMVLAFEILARGQDLSALAELCDGSQYTPAALYDAEHHFLRRLQGPLDHPDMDDATLMECPDWAYHDLKAEWGDDFALEAAALTYPAPLHIRVNTRLSNVVQVKHSLEKEGLAPQEGLISPYALRFTESVHLTQTNAFQKGWIEIQDEGSQAIALACAAQSGMQVLDYCAGGGGKTLALGDIMDGKGRIVAMDNDGKRLMRGKKRYIRADIHNVELRSLEEDRHRKWIKRQQEKFDIVLVDAPCSGTGTWRRNPDMRWRSGGQPALSDTLALQTRLLDRVAPYVKTGGALVYATCSLLPQENEAQVERFLAEHPDFSIRPLDDILPPPKTEAKLTTAEGFMRLTPHRHGTDGFFAARLIRG